MLGFQAIGSGMGAAGFIVYDDTTCMVDAAYRWSRFLSIESRGQCQVTDGNRCFLAVEEQVMVRSVLRAFPEEFVEHVELGRCPRPRRLPIPKLVDLVDGVATYDEAFWRKRPDWTFEPE